MIGAEVRSVHRWTAELKWINGIKQCLVDFLVDNVHVKQYGPPYRCMLKKSPGSTRHSGPLNENHVAYFYQGSSPTRKSNSTYQSISIHMGPTNQSGYHGPEELIPFTITWHTGNSHDINNVCISGTVNYYGQMGRIMCSRVNQSDIWMVREN